MQALDTTIANVALPYMQGSAVGDAGPDQLGADLLHRRRGHHDAADRLALPAGSAASACSWSPVAGFTVASVLCGIAAVAGRDRRCSACCRACSARRWCRCRRPCCSTSTRARSTARRWRCGAWASWSGPILGPDAGRLADRELQLALGVLHQRAGGRRSPSSASLDLPDRDQDARSVTLRLVRLRHAEPRPSARCSCCSTAASSSTGSPRPKSCIEAAVCAARVLSLPRPHLHGRAVRSSIRRLFIDRNFVAGLLFIFIVGMILLATLALLHAVSAEPDGLSGGHRRHRDGAARHRHDGRHDVLVGRLVGTGRRAR